MSVFSKEPWIRLAMIGDELLDGHTRDSNSSELIAALEPLGLRIRDQHILRDRVEDMQTEVQELLAGKGPDLVISTGGLGPTVDDCTRETLAEAFGQPLKLDEERWAELQERLKQRGRKPTDRQRRQALHPVNGQTLLNTCGSANGLVFEQGDRMWIAMPGVPTEMRAMLGTGLLPLLEMRYGARTQSLKVACRVLSLPEAELEATLEPLQDFLELGEIGFYPQPGGVLLRLRIPPMDPNQQKDRVQEFHRLMEERLKGESLLYDDRDPVNAVFALLKERGMTLALAESCTGGWMARMITDFPGSSEVFLGGVVSYSNAMKESLLKVPTEVLDKHGAVSKACALAMAEGMKSLCPADIALAVTGIAGPSGGTQEKPVGTVWLAMSTPRGMKARPMQIPGNRDQVRDRAAQRAWIWLLEEWS